MYLIMQLLVDFVYTFRNFVNFTSKKRNIAVYTTCNRFTLISELSYCDRIASKRNKSYQKFWEQIDFQQMTSNPEILQKFCNQLWIVNSM